MGKRSPSPPPAPDPVATANAQASANKETAIAQGEMNMVNQYTPYGQVEYAQRGTTAEGTPQYRVDQTLNEPQQRMLDLTNAAGVRYGETAVDQLNAMQGTLAKPVDYSSLGPAPVANEETRQSVRDSMLARMAPQFERDRETLETRLAGRGIGMGSGVYNEAMDEMNRARNDARLAADMQAGGEMSRQYGLEASARDRAINEMIQPRQQSLNEVAAMLSGSQVQNPQFVSTPQASFAPGDIMGATYAGYQGEMDAFRAQQSGQNAMMGGLFGLGSAALTGGMPFLLG